MSINYNPQIVTNGLVLCLDAANAKSFDANENLLTYSEQLDNVAWTKTRGSAVSNTAISPDNTLTADSFIEDTTATSSHYFFGSAVTLTIGLTYTFSCYVKANGRNFIAVQGDIGQGNLGGPTGFDLSTGVYTLGASVTSASITNVGSGWYRISVTAVATGINAYAGMALRTSYGVGIQTYTGDGTSGIYIWGAQFERASSASRYYATTGSAKNRGTSLIDLSGNGKNATLANGVVYNYFNNGILNFNGTNQYATCSHPTGSSYGITYEIFVKLNELTDNVILGFNNSTYFSGLSIIGGTRFIGYLSASNYKYFNNTTIQTGTWYHLVMYVGSSDASDIKGYVNGVLDTTTTNHTGTAYTPTTLTIAASNNLATYWLGCDIGIVRCYNRELTAAEVLQNYNANRGRFGI